MLLVIYIIIVICASLMTMAFSLEEIDEGDPLWYACILPQRAVWIWSQKELNKAGGVILVAFASLFIWFSNVVLIIGAVLYFVGANLWRLYKMVFGKKKPNR